MKIIVLVILASLLLTTVGCGQAAWQRESNSAASFCSKEENRNLNDTAQHCYDKRMVAYQAKIKPQIIKKEYPGSLEDSTPAIPSEVWFLPGAILFFMALSAKLSNGQSARLRKRRAAWEAKKIQRQEDMEKRKDMMSRLFGLTKSKNKTDKT